MNRKAVRREDLLRWVNGLISGHSVVAPADERGHALFRKISSSSELAPDFENTMNSPKDFLHPSSETVLSVRNSPKRAGEMSKEEEDAGRMPLVLFGMRPCDAAAVSVLDKVFGGNIADSRYLKRRKNAIIVALNCTRPCKNGFCGDMGSGPFSNTDNCDVLLTNLGGEYLLETGSQKGVRIAASLPGRAPSKSALDRKRKLQKSAETAACGRITVDGLPEILMRNLNHHIWRRVAEEKCLGCTNCTMVCPTCFCYDLKDETAMDLKETRRIRQWDSCQELNFARVHGGNFRTSREARLRQFVTHKLGTWVEQFGVFGCVGCGRCITWCPTGIDLTRIVRELRK